MLLARMLSDKHTFGKGQQICVLILVDSTSPTLSSPHCLCTSPEVAATGEVTMKLTPQGGSGECCQHI